MARRRRGRALSGILLLDKPAGMSSNQALQRAKRLYAAAKAGHTGSLDPLATGVLPLCFGEATKFSQYLLDADKVYETRITLGIDTETGDAEGAEIARADASGITEAGVEAVLESFRGVIEQLPPMHSAIKRDGKPLYKLARAGIEVERPTRTVHISRLDMCGLTVSEQSQLDVEVACSKGTYIRSLAADIGDALGTGGHVQMLRRTAVGPFAIGQCVSLETLQALRDRDELSAMDALLLPMDRALEHLPLLRLPESSGFYLSQGQPVQVRNAPRDGMVRVALESGEFLGVGEILDDGRVAPRRLVVSGR
ncbi:MAG: tRNA pseudouridine(55) synthase TruB [Pseudomonadota bacterium]